MADTINAANNNHAQATKSKAAQEQFKSKADKAQLKLDKDKESFLKILTTQLKYQDPSQPMDSSQFAQQLMQLTSVEQQINSNRYLEQLVSATNNLKLDKGNSYIGKYVEIDQSTVSLTPGKPQQIFYNLPKQASSCRVDILNDRGEKVASLKGAITPGNHELSWDGRGKNGNALPAGSYKIKIEAFDENGTRMLANNIKKGVVKEVKSYGDQIKLVLDDNSEIDEHQVMSMRNNKSYDEMSYLGKTVEFDRPIINWPNDKLGFTFTLEQDTDKLTMQILNKNGDVVRIVDNGPAKVGNYEYVWDGKDNKGNISMAGEYQIKIVSKGKFGEPIRYNTITRGNVTEIRKTSDNSLLLKLDNQLSILPQQVQALTTEQHNSERIKLQ